MISPHPVPGQTLGRRAGLLVPLFSVTSSASWGIGEIGDLAHLLRWMQTAGLSLLQLLPINELAPGEASPYSALSAQAIDPQFITVGTLEDFLEVGGEPALAWEWRELLAHVRKVPRIDYPSVRRLKSAALQLAFDQFTRAHWERDTPRAASFRRYVSQEGWWLEDYALFRALHAHFNERAWTEWPAPLRDRQPEALASARERLASDIRYRQYLQWVADTEWQAVRREAGATALFGDLPFMVSLDSADVWARQEEFRADASVGVPPDAFSDTGQDWGMPVYRWDVAQRTDLAWLRARGRRAAALFDGFRVDHVVGFYRTYFRVGGSPDGDFTPADPAAQLALGEDVLAALRAAGASLTAEDLGVIPDFVRASLTRLGVPGYKVFRWEREWWRDGQPFVDPATYPALSVATSGTHDTEPMVTWWEAAHADERAAVLAIPSIAAWLSPEEREALLGAPALTGPGLAALLRTLYHSGSDLLIQPVQDLFGWPDRVNRPATVNAENWSWRLPWPVDLLGGEPAARERAAVLHTMAREAGR
jgi:4-alpha-glucanotransferase